MCLSFLKNCQSSSPPELAVFQCLQTVALCTLSGINCDRLQEAQFNTKEAIALLEMVCMYLCFFFVLFLLYMATLWPGSLTQAGPIIVSSTHSPSHYDPPLVAYLSKGENGLLFLNVGVFTISSQHCCS